ncbi:MAG: hypothetical protein V1925_05235 [Candidatus Omnitrophota bacterium]
MGDGILKDKKGQATLETALAFIIIILFLGGIIKIWFWANNQIVQRQVRFNETRVAAGTSSDTYKLESNWPVYTPPALKEEDVLLGGK